MMLEENKALVRAFYHAFDQQDIEKGRSLMSEDVIAKGLDALPRQGIDAIMAYGNAMFTAFPDGQHTLTEVIAEGDKVVTRGTFQGTHQGKMMGLPPTGQRVAFSVIHIDRIANGQIIEHWGQADVFGMMQQLGALK